MVSVAKYWMRSGNAIRNVRALLAINQGNGFDRPGCAWGESSEKGPVKFCENGAKAVNWEATTRQAGPAFFRRYSVSRLSRQSDYWLEHQGRLTHPMQFDAASGHYVEVSWDEIEGDSAVGTVAADCLFHDIEKGPIQVSGLSKG